MTFNQTAYGWNADHVAELKRLWADGLSATEIAKAINAVSRDAVLAKVDRLGIQGRELPATPERAIALRAPAVFKKPNASQPGANGNLIRRLKAPEVVQTDVRNNGAFTRTLTAVPFKEPADPPHPRHRTLLDRLPGMCCFPVSGQGAETLYCCETIELEKRYCARHHAVMHVAPKQPVARAPVEAGAAYRHTVGARWRGLA